MKYLIGKKVGMTQRFMEDGTAVTVTAIEAGPCKVAQVKTREKDGYEAVQLGFDERKKLNKPEKGHLKDLPRYGVLREFPLKEQELKKGDELTVKQFAIGDSLDISGTSKGKGFQGVVKRHHFKGSKKTHGNKDQLRMPGSIGSTGPARVFKNMRMPGRMGNEQVTVKNSEVVDVDPAENLIFVKGAVPGHDTAIVTLFSLSTTEAKYKDKPEPKIEEPKEAVETKHEEKAEMPKEEPKKNEAKSEEKAEEKPAV